MIERTLFTPTTRPFATASALLREGNRPHHDAWEEQGYVDRAVWNKAGENGFLCMTMPEEYGGSGADKLYSVVQFEELNARGLTGIGYSLHSEIVAPYILHYGTPEQKAKYLPKLASGEMIGAIAMSEPAAGSDLQGIKSPPGHPSRPTAATCSTAARPSSPTAGMPTW
jgi:alkylation response protein AidB-like acyl-CoA dehydrogenase